MQCRALDSAEVALNSAAMQLLVPAKINLHLRVGPRRPDGFHSLLSWMTTVGLFDKLRLETKSTAEEENLRPEGAGNGTGPDDVSREGPTARVALECNLPGLPCDERNLVVKIALALGDELRSASSGVRIIGSTGDVPHPARRAGRPVRVTPLHAVLEKKIPVGAGLGGGSSDGARALLGLNQLWEAGWAADDLSAFAARFGSDLSFFIYGPSSICQGRGEIVTPLTRPAPRWAALVLPRISMPTADVYRRFDQMGLGRDRDIEVQPDWNAWTQLDSQSLLTHLINDLEAPAFNIAPQLGNLRERVEDLLGRPVRMSGSGSSLFTLFDTQDQAISASQYIERNTNERAPAVEISPDLVDDLNG